MDMEEIAKPGWRPKFQSEYSMGELDFQRFNKTLENIDTLSSMVNSCYVPELELMQKFFSELINLYDDFRPLISVKSLSQEFDEIIDQGVTLKRLWENSKKNNLPMNKTKIFEFIDLTRKLKTKLYSIKQVIGLGIKVKRNMTPQERIEAGMRNKDYYGELPEV